MSKKPKTGNNVTAKQPAENEDAAQQQRRHIGPKRSGVKLPARVHQVQIQRQQSLAKIEPYRPARAGEPSPKVLGLDRLTADSLMGLKPYREQAKDQRQNEERTGPQAIQPREPPALPPGAAQQHHRQHYGRGLAKQRQHEGRQR